METIFKATVMFLLTFSVPTETDNPEIGQVLTCTGTSTSTTEVCEEPRDEMESFWLTGFLMLAE